QEKGVLGVCHAAPGAEWDVGWAIDVVYLLIGYLVGNMGRFGRFVLADVDILPGHQLACAVEASTEAAADGGAVVILAGILFAAPQGLHRHIKLLGNQSGLIYGVVVTGQASAKAAAKVLRMQCDLIFFQASDPGNLAAYAKIVLSACPHF